MFPLKLQRNIAQLDRQISLLEDEYKGIEVEKKRRSQMLEPTFSSCSKNSNARMKAPTVRVTVKKTDTSSKRTKKPTPPVSSRLQSPGSLPCRCRKSLCESGDALPERKSKLRGLNVKAPVYSCQTLGSPGSNSKKENKCVKCRCNSEVSLSELGSDKHVDGKKKDHVLFFPNSGGTIEVTVTQKPNNGKENSPMGHKSPVRKSVNSGIDIENDLDGCKCQVKGQKWSEILCADSSKKRQSNGNFVKNKIHPDETKTIYQPFNPNNNRKVEENISYENRNNSTYCVQEESIELPIKLPSQSCKTKRQSEAKSNKFEKEVQCSLESCDHSEHANELKDPVKIFKLLINQFQQMSDKDSKKSTFHTDSITKVEDPQREASEVNKKNASETARNNVTYLNTVKHHCENLIKDKLLLTEELATRDNAIAAMRRREEEYLSLISSMKSSLEKTRENAQEGVEAVKQMNVIKSKLSEQMKISESLKEKLTKLREQSQGYSLENDKLRTQIKILQLEAQKHEILMAGKEAEINRYREEIQNFQRQIKDHLVSLKTNAQEIDLEKMVEVIMQRSQIFGQTDLDSVIEKDEKDSSRTPNGLMHSSPTSGKTSIMNSSWKDISSIHEDEQGKENSDVIFLNMDENGKDFFQIFGDNTCSEAALPEETKKPSAEKLLEKREVKNSSFTSCISAEEGRITTKSSSRDSLISSDGTAIFDEDTIGERVRKNSGISSDKAQSNIDELLKSMKLKFSKEIFDNSLPSCTTGDYIDMSQISSISPL